MSQEILYEIKDGVGRITFNRPEARNAFTFRMYERLCGNLPGGVGGFLRQGDRC